jgi:hypothetical protein
VAKSERTIDLSHPLQKRLLIDWIKSRQGLHTVEIHKLRDQRSLAQNAYLWGVVYPHVLVGMQEAWGDEEITTADEVHEFLKKKFLQRPVVNRKSGELMGYTEPSTAALDTAEFAAYLDQIIKFASEYLNTEIPIALRAAERRSA